MKKYQSSKYGAEIDKAIDDVAKIKNDYHSIEGRIDNIENEQTEQKGINQSLFNSITNISDSCLLSPITQEEYDALQTKCTTLYFIRKNNRLEKIYYGATCIAKRGEQASNTGFPLVFPIIFN